jgi:hypothetical protein
MPALKLVLPESWEELVLWMEGLRWTLGLVYQISSSRGAIAIQTNLINRIWNERKWGQNVRHALYYQVGEDRKRGWSETTIGPAE